MLLDNAGEVCFRVSPPSVARAAMQDDGTLKLRADARVVQIDVIVRDSQGKRVDDLTKSDFTVTDNGKPRAFTIFSVSGDTPRDTGPFSVRLNWRTWCAIRRAGGRVRSRFRYKVWTRGGSRAWSFHTM
jgi:hypothetical protein